MSRTARSCVLSLVLAALGWSSESGARSTVVARFVPDAVVSGPADQVARLHLQYFPGDGEAIVGAAIEFDPRQLQVNGAEAALGQAAVDGGAVP